jgi:hypothetical protein
MVEARKLEINSVFHPREIEKQNIDKGLYTLRHIVENTFSSFR